MHTVRLHHTVPDDRAEIFDQTVKIVRWRYVWRKYSDGLCESDWAAWLRQWKRKAPCLMAFTEPLCTSTSTSTSSRFRRLKELTTTSLNAFLMYDRDVATPILKDNLSHLGFAMQLPFISSAWQSLSKPRAWLFSSFCSCSSQCEVADLEQPPIRVLLYWSTSVFKRYHQWAQIVFLFLLRIFVKGPRYFAWISFPLLFGHFSW